LRDFKSRTASIGTVRTQLTVHVLQLLAEYPTKLASSFDESFGGESPSIRRGIDRRGRRRYLNSICLNLSALKSFQASSDCRYSALEWYCSRSARCSQFERCSTWTKSLHPTLLPWTGLDQEQLPVVAIPRMDNTIHTLGRVGGDGRAPARSFENLLAPPTRFPPRRPAALPSSSTTSPTTHTIRSASSYTPKHRTTSATTHSSTNNLPPHRIHPTHPSSSLLPSVAPPIPQHNG
jgi:hypothetical protein